MNNKILLIIWLSLIIVSWCTTKNTSSDIQTDTWEIITWSVEVNAEDSNDLISSSEISGYAPVSPLDPQYFDKQRQEWEQRFYVNDRNWKGKYYPYRDWILVGTMELQAADVFYGYHNWWLFMELWVSIIQFPVDEKTYISYYPQLENPNYTGTGTLQVQDKRDSYQVCKDGYSMEQEEVVYDRDRYEVLVVKNPIRCFWEDKTYIYGRREYEQSKDWGYELMRIEK